MFEQVTTLSPGVCKTAAQASSHQRGSRADHQVDHNDIRLTAIEPDIQDADKTTDQRVRQAGLAPGTGVGAGQAARCLAQYRSASRAGRGDGSTRS